MNRSVILLFILFFLSLDVPGRADPASPGPHPANDQTCGYVVCDKKSGMCMLKANLGTLKKTTTFDDFDLCIYEPGEKKWHWMPFNVAVEKTISPVQKQVSSADTDPVVRLLTDVKGLFWLSWRENGELRASFVYSGMLCNDVMIGSVRKGDLIATCIPGKDTATAAYVPDPALYCRKGKSPGKGVQ